MSMRNSLFLPAAFLGLMLLALPAMAQQEQSFQQKLTRAETELNQVEKLLAEIEAQPADVLNQAISATAWIRDLTTQCVTDMEARVARLSTELEGVSSNAAADTPEVERIREDLENDLRTAAQNLGMCRVLTLRRQELVSILAEQRQQLLTRHLLSRGPDIVDVARATLSDPLQLWNTSRDFVLRDTGVDRLDPVSLTAAGLGALFALWLGLQGRRLMLAHAARIKDTGTLSSGLARASLTCYGAYLPHLLVSAAIALVLTLMREEAGSLPFVTLLAYGLGLYILMVASIRVFLRPCRPAAHWLPIATDITRPLGKRLQVLALLLLIGFLFFGTLTTRSFPEQIQLLVRGIYAAFLALNLIWVVWLAGRLPRWRNPKRIGFFLTLILLAALAAEWLGYTNLSLFLARGLMITLVALGLILLLARTLRELFDSLDEGRFRWQKSLRQSMGIKDGNYIPGLSWVRFTVALALWGGTAIFLLRVWGLSDAGLDQLLGWLSNGFQIGDIQIVPKRVFFAVLIMALLLGAAGWIKKQSADQWFKRTRMDRGAREASVTMIGYVGVAVALLVALSVAGVEFTNLAIIAGALSVGIGFGLQNIVNNFVSGLILLFERPIRTGDWIVVGGTEGYVKQISIRSTQIQTFDRADVIVPNSELISGQVVNWMLHDPWGRLKLPVGVAYGSDTAKVKEILLKVAGEHELVLRDHPIVPPPTVLFLAFGASSLDFELRCHIRQVDSRLSVLSDLNFAIDRAFREAGIEIPFPQRDLHLKSWPGSADPGSSEAGPRLPGAGQPGPDER